MRKVYIFVGAGGEGKTWILKKAGIHSLCDRSSPNHLDKLLESNETDEFEMAIETNHLTSKAKSQYFRVCDKYKTELVVVAFKKVNY